MKTIFDSVSYTCSKTVTEHYSTSFLWATRMLGSTIRKDIHNIYGFVRFADEIVDSFHDYDKTHLFNKFEDDLIDALTHRISLNPILNSFQHTFYKYDIPMDLVTSFLKSMRKDLEGISDFDQGEYAEYIHGSAEVVGLMCLKVFVKGDRNAYNRLEKSAMALGAAFQKVNFLRDLKSDYMDLNRRYFPNTDIDTFNERSKRKIIEEIEANFELGHSGILQLPGEAKFGVYTAYKYYSKLLQKLKHSSPLEIRNRRIRVSNYQKFGLLATSYVNYRLKII